MNRIFGHKNALTAVRETIEAAAQIGLRPLHYMLFQQKTGKDLK